MVIRVNPVILALSTILDESAGAKLGEGLLQLFIRVHHDGAAPGNRLLQGSTGHQKESDACFSGLDCHLIAAVEQHQRTVPDFIRQRGAHWPNHIGLNPHRVRRITKPAGPFEYISEGVVGYFDWERLALAWRHRNV